ncbi:MAG: hypothetical protein RL042_2457 [Nitrospirota bacterium]|jgi:hypothetical protein
MLVISTVDDEARQREQSLIGCRSWIQSTRHNAGRDIHTDCQSEVRGEVAHGSGLPLGIEGSRAKMH